MLIVLISDENYVLEWRRVDPPPSGCVTVCGSFVRICRLGGFYHREQTLFQFMYSACPVTLLMVPVQSCSTRPPPERRRSYPGDQIFSPQGLVYRQMENPV